MNFLKKTKQTKKANWAIHFSNSQGVLVCIQFPISFSIYFIWSLHITHYKKYLFIKNNNNNNNFKVGEGWSGSLGLADANYDI